MGRNRKPTSLKLVDGTYRESRAAKNEAKPPVSVKIPKPPEQLTAEAKREWRRAAPMLHRLGLLSQADLPVFACYCQAWADFLLSVETIKYAPKVVKTPNGHLQVHPLMTMRRQCADQLLRFAGQFGMTPAARTKIDIANLPAGVGAGGGDDEENLANQLLGPPPG